MRVEKAEYAKCSIGPGGRHCSCCAPIPQVLKRMEHRKARHNERKFVAEEMRNAND